MDRVMFTDDIRDRDWPKAGLTMLAMLLAAVLAFAVAQTRELASANAKVDAMVQKAFYETCELTEGMAVNFRKLLVAGEKGQMQALLNETALQTQGAMSDLAILPLGQDTVSATLKFINQAGDFARALSVKLGNGGEITPEDHETLEKLSETAAGFSVSLARLLDRYERGEAVFGGEAMVPTLTGKVLCKIAPGTQSGSKIRLKGKGIVFMQEPKKYGDEYVTIRIEVPKYLTPEERRKLKEYQEVSDKNKADKNGRGHVA